MTPAGMTKRMAQALAFIEAFIAEHGYSPNYQEIAGNLGLKSRSGACDVVDRLVQRGVITKLDGHSRSIAIVRQARAA